MTTLEIFHRMTEGLLESLFPRRCSVCGLFLTSRVREEKFIKGNLCVGCERGFIFLSAEEICKCCGNVLAANTTGSVCGSCIGGKHIFSLARSVVAFAGPAADSVKLLKYAGQFQLGGFLSMLVLDFFPADFGGFDVVVPVPLHPARLRQREFNQSALVSSKLALSMKKPHVPFALERVLNTTPQASFSGINERRKNVRGAFSTRGSERKNLKNKRVMLFDDVFTTGSTVNECAEALLCAGAREVKVLTVFRTVI